MTVGSVTSALSTSSIILSLVWTNDLGFKQLYCERYLSVKLKSVLHRDLPVRSRGKHYITNKFPTIRICTITWFCFRKGLWKAWEVHFEVKVSSTEEGQKFFPFDCHLLLGLEKWNVDSFEIKVTLFDWTLETILSSLLSKSILTCLREPLNELDVLAAVLLDTRVYQP